MMAPVAQGIVRHLGTHARRDCERPGFPRAAYSRPERFSRPLRSPARRLARRSRCDRFPTRRFTCCPRPRAWCRSAPRSERHDDADELGGVRLGSAAAWHRRATTQAASDWVRMRLVLPRFRGSLTSRAARGLRFYRTQLPNSACRLGGNQERLLMRSHPSLLAMRSSISALSCTVRLSATAATPTGC